MPNPAVKPTAASWLRALGVTSSLRASAEAQRKRQAAMGTPRVRERRER